MTTASIGPISAEPTTDSDVAPLDIDSIRKRADVAGLLFRAGLLGSLAISLLILLILLTQVVIDSRSVLTTRLGGFLTSGLGSNPELAGIAQGLRGTLYLCMIVAIVAFPMGIAAAIYLEEYAPENRLTNFIGLNIRNLAGVPSVVYGILGLTIFVKGIPFVTGGRTPLAAGLTMACLVLPVIIITASEALRAVPAALKEAGYGVGATKWEVIRDHTLPYAAPGILTGTLLSVARAAGEAAPLILVGTITGFLSNTPAWWDVGQLREKFTAMPIVIATWVRQPEEGFKVDAAAAAIVALVTLVIVLNSIAIYLRGRFEKKRIGG